MIEQKNLKSILWDVSQKCNLNCIHCYNAENISNEKQIDILNNYKIIVDNAISGGFNHFHLLGGEPLLVQGIFELIEYATRMGIFVSINTNGILLTPKIINKLIDLDVKQLTISLDGATESTNDVVRGNGSFKIVTKNLNNTANLVSQRNSNMVLQVATVITKQNISTIHNMPKILYNLGIKYLDILRLYECGNAIRNESILQVSDENYLMVLSKLLLESYRKNMYLQIDCKPKVLELLNSRFGFSKDLNLFSFASCPAGKNIIYMASDGNIFPCGPFYQEAKNTDLKTNIFSDDYLVKLFEIEKKINYRIIENSGHRKKICNDCKYNSSCNGCAICYKEHETLCETASRIFAV